MCKTKQCCPLYNECYSDCKENKDPGCYHHTHKHSFKHEYSIIYKTQIILRNNAGMLEYNTCCRAAGLKISYVSSSEITIMDPKLHMNDGNDLEYQTFVSPSLAKKQRRRPACSLTRKRCVLAQLSGKK